MLMSVGRLIHRVGAWGLLGVLGATPRAEAASYTVPGDFSTIQAALNAAAAGDTVTVGAGTYAEKLSFPHGGSAVQGYLTLQAAPGETPILDGAGVPGENMVLIDSKSYVKVVGFEIRNNLGVSDGSGVRILGAGSHIEIRNNTIHDMRGRNAMGITVYATEPSPISDLIVDGNQIYDCEPSPSEALTLNGNVTGFAVTNNVVRDVNNIGIDFIGGETDIQADPSKVARDGVCRGNQVLRARAPGDGYAGGIYIDGGSDIVVENNLVSQCDLGIEVGAENAGVIASGNIVRNNLVFANEKAGLVFGGYAASVGRANDNQFLNNTCYQNDTLGAGYGELWIQYAADNVVRNNIFSGTSQGLLLASYGGNVNNTLDYNLWFSEVGAGAARFIWSDTEHAGFAAYRAATAQDANSIFADPQLVDPAAGNLHLAATSPAVNAGDPAFVPGTGETDIDGGPRINGARVDIGADEAGQCGNGVPEAGEQCDDGNLVDCDTCDSNCTTPACGNGVVCAPEICDDGNSASGDCCSAACTLEPLGSSCDDGDWCTTADACDGAGVCLGGQAPDILCLDPSEARTSTLLLKDRDDARRDSLLWKWRKGPDVPLVAFGDPVSVTTYALCVYDESGSIPSIVMKVTIPPGSSWRSLGQGGFKYGDGGGATRGIRRIKLKPGGPGKAKLLVKGKGAGLMPPALPLAQDATVTVQLKNSDGSCWGARFSAPADVNTSEKFKDRSDAP